MQIIIPEAHRHDGEIHRYFPEWAVWPERDALPVETDLNSYSAGGYAEEFGYGAQAGLPPPLPLLQRPGPALWHWFSMGLHPGYPQCATPLDRDHVAPIVTLLVESAVRDASSASGLGAGVLEPRKPTLSVIRVGCHRASASRINELTSGVLDWWRALRLRRSRL